MAGVLPQYLATPATYGVRSAAPAPAAFARPITTGTTATRVGAPTTGIAGGRSYGTGAVGTIGPSAGVVAPSYRRPPTTSATPAPQTAAAPKPYVNPFADDGSQAKRQAELQAQMDARSAAQRDAAMQQQQFEAMLRQQSQQGQQGGGYGFQPTPIPIAEGPQAAAEPQPSAPAPLVLPGQQAQSPDVGTGWADFAARPTGPQGLGMSRQSAPMQALKAIRAGGGLY